MQTLPQSTKNNVLDLLGLAVVADERVFAEEVFAFVKIGLALGAGLSEARLHEWFSNNRSSLRARLNDRDFAQWLPTCLDKVANQYEPITILNHLRDIAASDQDIHVSETALIVLAARHWGLDLPELSVSAAP